MAKPIVAYWNSQPTPYMVGRWNAVARRGNLDMHAWFNVEREPDRSWTVDERTWAFTGRYLPARSLGRRSVHLPIDELRTLRPDLVVQEYSSLSMMLGLCLSAASASRVTLRALPTFDTWTPRSPVKEFAKHQIFRAVDAVKTGGSDGLSMTRRYGLPAQRGFAVTQSIDTALYGEAVTIPEVDRLAFRSRLGLSGTVFVYVGRLWERKGLDFLFTAYESLRQQGANVSLLLIGDGVDHDHYRARANSDPRIVFAGFLQAAEVAPYFSASDVFVFPTLGDPHGLVIEEAMAAGLPVVVTSAAGDVQARVPDGEAGFIVPPADSDALADRMMRLTSDPALRRSMAKRGRTLALERSHEIYADDFERFVSTTLERAPRDTPQRRAVTLGGRLLNPILSRTGRDGAA